MNELTERARRLRAEQTRVENIFWQRVRNNKTGYKIVRQKPLRFFIGKKLHYFIADFYCQKLRLAIELDGKIHEDQKEYDQARDYIIKQMKIKVIRITNDDVLKNLEHVIKTYFPSPDWEGGGSRRLTG